MGLSVVHGIVKRHNGAITVHSEPGRGSSFEVYLPTIISESIEETDILSSLDAPHGKGSILLVDDENNLVDIGIQLLEDLEYNVTGVSSSIKAYEIFKKDYEKFDLVITDMTMPDMTGMDLIKKYYQCGRGSLLYCAVDSVKLLQRRRLKPLEYESLSGNHIPEMKLLR